MKLARITKPLRSVQVRVMLTGDLNATLECYAQYYQYVHGDSVDTRWARSADRNQPRRVPAPASTNDSTKAPA